MIEFRRLLESLDRNGVAFVIIGGIAATLHGSARVTFDLDVVYERTPDNLQQLVTALAPFAPYLRGAPPGLPFTLDVETLKRGLNFTLTTSDGSIDLLGEVSGVGNYRVARERSEEAHMFGGTYYFLNLEALILSKKAAGRPKDFETIAELEAIREERERTS
jgi:predicted nucleotidyltransferase